MNFQGTKKLLQMVSHDLLDRPEKLLSMGFEIWGLDAGSHYHQNKIMSNNTDKMSIRSSDKLLNGSNNKEMNILKKIVWLFVWNGSPKLQMIWSDEKLSTGRC